MTSQLDPTLSQVLSELYAVSAERDQFRSLLTQMNAKLDDQGYLLGRLNEVRTQAGQAPIALPADAGAPSSEPAPETELQAG
jgi:hypothetical protein